MQQMTIPAAQLKAAGEWVESEIDMPARAELTLVADILRVTQGDSRASFLADGTMAHEEV